MSGPPVTIELNPKEQRLYDQLRERLAPPTAGNASGFGDVLLFLPDLTILLLRLLRDERVPLLDKGLAVAGLAYVFSPIDVLPALVMGPVGLLDDLFIVAACLSRLVNHVHPDVVRSHWSGRGDALEVIQNTTGWFERELALRVSDLRRFLAGRGAR
ncbi:MAG: YkvA family protein [bacterium]|nr:YkvA family protein [bacterium]